MAHMHIANQRPLHAAPPPLHKSHGPARGGFMLTDPIPYQACRIVASRVSVQFQLGTIRKSARKAQLDVPMSP